MSQESTTTNTPDNQTLNSNNFKVSLNISDINEFPLLECTNEIYLTSPSSPTHNTKSSSNPLIIRKDPQTLLSSTSSFFQDAENAENNQLIQANTITSIYNETSSQDMVNTDISQKVVTTTTKTTKTPCVTSESGICFINAEFSGCKESTPCVDGGEREEDEGRLADCSEVQKVQNEEVMEDEDVVGVRTILPQLMDRSLKEVNYLVETDQMEVNQEENEVVNPDTIEHSEANLLGTSTTTQKTIDSIIQQTNPTDTSIPSDSTNIQDQQTTVIQTTQQSALANHQLQEDIPDCDIVQAEMNLQDIMQEQIYEKISVVEHFQKKVTYFIRKSGAGGRGLLSGRFSSDLELVDTTQKRERINKSEFVKGVDLCNRSYRGLGSVLTELETEIIIEGPEVSKSNLDLEIEGRKRSGDYGVVDELMIRSRRRTNSNTSSSTPRRRSAIKTTTSATTDVRKRRSARSKIVAAVVAEKKKKKKRQSETTENESDLEELKEKKESPEKKRAKTTAVVTKPAFSFASLRINLSPNRKRLNGFGVERMKEKDEVCNVPELVQNEEIVVTEKIDESEKVEEVVKTVSSNDAVSSLKPPSPIAKQTSEPRISPDLKHQALLNCHVSIDRSQTIDSLISLTPNDSIQVDSKGSIKIIKREESPTVPRPNRKTNLITPNTPISSKLSRPIKNPASSQKKKPAKIQSQLSDSSNNKQTRFNVGDIVLTNRVDGHEYYPAVICQIKNILYEKSYKKLYRCEYLVPEMLEDELVQTEFLEGCMLVKYDWLMTDDRIKVWLNSKKRYCSAVVVSLRMKEKVSPSDEKIKNKNVMIDVRLEDSGLTKTSEIRNICLQEETFLSICRREHGSAPTENICIDTRQFNHFSETCLNTSINLNDSNNSDDILVLD